MSGELPPLIKVKGNVDLTNFLEIKLRGSGIRVIYKLIRTETEMLIVVVGMREDCSEAYRYLRFVIELQ